MDVVNIDGKRLAYMDEGQGTPILLVHCSSASHKMWKPLMLQLGPGYRFVAPDLYGYGQSDSFSGEISSGIETDIRFLEFLLHKITQPLHLVAHSYGAAMALEALLRYRSSECGGRANQTILSLTLIEPVSFYLLRNRVDSRTQWDEVERVAKKTIAHVQAGRYRAAARTYMQYWVGLRGWLFMGAKSRRKIAQTVNKVATEFAMSYGDFTPLEDHHRLSAPTQFIQGGKTRASAKRIIELLQAVLPESVLVEIPNAGHLCPLTHAAAVNRVIIDYIQNSERTSVAQSESSRQE